VGEGDSPCTGRPIQRGKEGKKKSIISRWLGDQAGEISKKNVQGKIEKWRRDK